MTRFKVGVLTLAAVLAVGPAPAQAQTTMTFDGNACSGSDAIFGNTEGYLYYLESGFQLRVGGYFPPFWGAWCSGSPNYPGSPAFFDKWSFGIRLTKFSGGTFALNSIDLASRYEDGDAGSAIFTGYLFGGGTVSVTKSWTAASGFPTFSTADFDGSWADLTEVWIEPRGSFQLDNIVLDRTSDVVPEPATITLLATGLAGMVAARRKRRME